MSFSFKELDKDSRSIAVIIDVKDRNCQETVYINDMKSYDEKEDLDLEKEVEKYAESINKNESNVIQSFKLKPEYEFRPVPYDFAENRERMIKFIVGKSGSGKSWYIAKWLQLYNYMYPKNKIYFICNKSITEDKSYAELIKLKPFLKSFCPLSMLDFRSVLDFKEFDNCLFVFDDVIDMKPIIPLEYAAYTILSKKLNRSDITNAQIGELMAKDLFAVTERASVIAKQVKNNIADSIGLILKAGRKNGISALIVDHKLFSGRQTGDLASAIIDESHQIVLFPYSNISDETLIEFFKKKLSFDRGRSLEIIKRRFKKFEYLLINTSETNFALLSNEIKILPRNNERTIK